MAKMKMIHGPVIQVDTNKTSRSRMTSTGRVVPIETITITGTATDVSDPAAPGFWQALIDAQHLPFKVVRKPTKKPKCRDCGHSMSAHSVKTEGCSECCCLRGARRL